MINWGILSETPVTGWRKQDRPEKEVAIRCNCTTGLRWSPGKGWSRDGLADQVFLKESRETRIIVLHWPLTECGLPLEWGCNIRQNYFFWLKPITGIWVSCELSADTILQPLEKWGPCNLGEPWQHSRAFTMTTKQQVTACNKENQVLCTNCASDWRLGPEELPHSSPVWDPHRQSIRQSCLHLPFQRRKFPLTFWSRVYFLLQQVS